LHGIPNVEFYRKLHSFLKKWEQTYSVTHASVGRFYIYIDQQLQKRGSNPSNTYWFIEKVVSSERSNAALMPYDITQKPHTVTEQQGVYDDETIDHDITSEVETTKMELICAQESLKKLTHEKNLL